MEKFDFASSHDVDNKKLENISSEKEAIFNVLVINEIISAFSEDLDEAGFETEQISEVEKEIESCSEEDVKSVLSLPRELRLRNFPLYLKDIVSGKKTIHEIVLELTSIARRNHYTVGYHASNNNIFPIGNDWQISGKELDDRDDMSMAYYSLDYKNIFRTNRFKWLYIVRAQTGEDSTHKKDTSNNWGRAPSLPIVSQINLNNIEEQVESIYSAKIKENQVNNKGAA